MACYREVATTLTPNLDTLSSEIRSFLESEGFNLFYGYSRLLDDLPIVYWDFERHPNYRDFVQVARRASVALMVFHQREFDPGQIDEALERLDSFDLSRDEYRSIERRLKELRAYEGFTCALELSFDYGGRIYLLEVRTDWYEELSDLMESINMVGGQGEDEDDSAIGGYFSKN